MASKLPPPKGVEFTFRTALFAQTNNQLKTTPTIAAGDFQVSKDGGAFGNLATLPDENPDSSGQVLVTLSATEMDADEVTVRVVDAAGAEWNSFFISIPTSGQTFDTAYFDPANDLVKLHGTQGAVTFGQVKVAANVANEGALHITNANADGRGLHAEGGYYGSANIGSVAGQYNEGDAVGGAGQRNEATSANGHGQYNYATGGGTGQTNYGLTAHVSPMWATPGADGDTLETLSDQLDAIPTTALDAAGVRTAVGLATANLDTQLDNLPTNTELTTALGTADDAVIAAIGALNNLSTAQVNAEMVDVLRTDTIPDSYAADGAQPTMAQAMLMIWQFLSEKELAGTTITVNKPDGTTGVMTFTLDDATDPTTITRSA